MQYQVFLFNKNNSIAVIVYQIFQSNTNKNAASNIEQVQEVAPHKAPAVRSPTTITKTIQDEPDMRDTAGDVGTNS